MLAFNRLNDTRRRGHVAVLIAVSMVAIIGMCAISLDGGTLLSERRHAQATADAAALAAAGELYFNYWAAYGYDSSGTAKAAALASAVQNRYLNDGTDTTVTVNIPPKSGDHVGKAGYAEVIVQSNQTRGFSSIFGSDRLPVIARAVAVGLPEVSSIGIVVLNPTDKGAFGTNGNGTFVLEGAPVNVDSSHPQSSIASGNGSFTAPEYDMVGNYTANGGGSFTGTINTNQKYVPDPLKYLPEPDPTSMITRSTKKTQYTDGDITLQPGVYKGGLSASGDASLTLMPGIYYMDEGGFSFSGKGSLTGNGVMIYNAPGNGGADKVSITGQGAVTLSPLTSGIYQGMAIWQDRTSSVPAKIAGNGDVRIQGTLYFAAAELSVSGEGTLNNLGSQYVSDKLQVGGNGNIKIVWDGQKVARSRLISLVE